MNINLIKSTVVLVISFALFCLYCVYYYPHNFIGNYYQDTDEPVFSFGKNNIGYLKQEKEGYQLKYPFKWYKGTSKGIKVNALVFIPSGSSYFPLPTVNVGSSRKQTPLDWPIAFYTAKQLASADPKYAKFNNIGLFTPNWGTDEKGEAIFFYLPVKKSLIIDLKNCLKKRE